MSGSFRTTLTAALLTLVAVLSGCGADEPTVPGTLKIGFITKFPTGFYDIMADAVKAYDKQHPDIDVIFGQSKSGNDDQGQIALIDSMIAQGVRAIAVTPTSPTIQDALDKARQAGIKIILVDNDIPDWSGKSSVVATDNLAGGKLAGQWLAAHLPPNATIGVLQGRLGNPTLDKRVEGMRDGLNGRARVVAAPPTDCDAAKGLTAARDILTTYPRVTAIYSACGPPAAGALQAIKAAKKLGSVTLVGFDASTEELTAILAGEQAASVAQFPAKMGSLGIETAVAAARGQTVPATIDTGTEMVTKENAASFQPPPSPSPSVAAASEGLNAG